MFETFYLFPPPSFLPFLPLTFAIEKVVHEQDSLRLVQKVWSSPPVGPGSRQWCRRDLLTEFLKSKESWASAGRVETPEKYLEGWGSSIQEDY